MIVNSNKYWHITISWSYRMPQTVSRFLTRRYLQLLVSLKIRRVTAAKISRRKDGILTIFTVGRLIFHDRVAQRLHSGRYYITVCLISHRKSGKCVSHPSNGTSYSHNVFSSEKESGKEDEIQKEGREV